MATEITNEQMMAWHRRREWALAKAHMNAMLDSYINSGDADEFHDLDVAIGTLYERVDGHLE